MFVICLFLGSVWDVVAAVTVVAAAAPVSIAVVAVATAAVGTAPAVVTAAAALAAAAAATAVIKVLRANLAEKVTLSKISQNSYRHSMQRRIKEDKFQKN